MNQSTDNELEDLLNGHLQDIKAGHGGKLLTALRQREERLVNEARISAKHEQRHQEIGVSRWISVGVEHGYWNHPMTFSKAMRYFREQALTPKEPNHE